MRFNGRKECELRPVSIRTGFNIYAEGSVQIQVENTIILVTATVEEHVPPFLKGSGKGWVTAEYNMLPRATASRNQREGRRGNGIGGRTQEIQRLIGRSLRAVCDLEALGERTITLDCDVLQADGGTRTASITAAWLALVMACDKLVRKGILPAIPVNNYLAAVSVGMRNQQILMDLCYDEDSNADVDMNVVMTGSGEFVEIQGTGEEATFDRVQMNRMLDMAEVGIQTLIQKQKEILQKANINF